MKVSVADRKASEGGSVGFEVRLSGAVSSEVVVSYATSEDGTGANPAAGTDYTAVSATELTFRPGEALMQTATVATVEDELNEADETFTLTISAPDPEVAGVSLGDAEAVGTITDDDELTVSVAGPVANVEEGQTATFTVTVEPQTKDSTTAVVVSYEVDTDASTASSGDDYTAPSGTELTIGVGETSGTIEVVTNTDAVLEPDETLVLKLTGASTAGAVGVSATAATAQATIEDNGTVKVSVADRKASEGGSVGFEVRLSGAVSSEVVVSYATSQDGTGANPAAGTDYTAVSATELTFRPGEALMQTATVATVEDELNEADETFKLTISAPDPEVAGVSLGDAEAVGTITDDDELTVSVAGPVANVEEGQTATFTVTVEPQTKDSTTAVVVSYEVDTGASTASSGDDYTAPSGTELTIGVGETSETIEIVTNTDSVLEPHETLVLELTGASTAGEVDVSATAATAQATIEDNGTVKVSVADRKASEGGSVGFEVRLSGAVSSEVVVSYATSEDGTGTNPAAGTDYTAVSATELTFRPGEALMQTVAVATVEDELNEADETFKLTISAPDPEVAGVSLGDAEAVGTITDDDELTVSVAGPVANVEEGQTATFTVTVTGTSTTAVVVSYEVDTDASTAAAPGDYTAPSEVELTIGVGETSGTIEIVTNTDSVLEPHETLVLELTGASTAGEVDVSATAATAQATIEDNGTVKVSVADRKASEGGSVGFEVRLSGAVSSEVVVSYATSADGTGTNPAAGTDYTAVSATELTFRPGEALMQTVTVATVEDELNEADETFKLTISAPDPEVAGVSLGDAEAVGTITDDDELTVSVAGPVANVEEGQTATFTVTVEPQTKDSTTAVVVSYEVDTDASTAAAPGDYTAPSEVELTIGAGVASGTIEVVTNTDAVLEPDETLVLKLTGASTAGAVGVSATAATATIEDNGTVKVSVADRKASEGGSVGFEVRLSGAVSSEVVVSYATSEDGTGANPAAGTDYTAVSATELTFRPGEALMQTATVATVEDELNEADETFKLTISAPDPEVAGVSLGDAEAVGTIEDDDELTVSVAGPVANVEEGQTATFTVTVTGTSTTAVVVSYEVDTDASTAAAPGDYTALSEVELTIGVGETSGTIEVVTNTDAVLEPHETLVLKLTGASTAGAVGVSATAATATIEDNGTVKVSVADRKASEGGSVGFEVRLSGAVSSEVVVSYATSEDGTGANPAAGTDYTAVSATELTFRPGEALMQTVTVATVEDELNEADETFKLTISAPDPEVAGVSLGDAEAVGTITDDDELTVSVAGPVANVEEGQTATFTVTVEPQTKDSTTAVVVSYEVDTDASTAAAPGDYTAPSEVELTIGAGVASGTIEVVTNTDAVLEPDETLVLKLTGASTAGAVGVSATAATATIEDNGTVKVSVADRKASEGGSVGFEVRLSGAVSSEVVVSYATSEDGTGANPAAGTDYTAVSATELTFRPGEALMQTATVATVEDELNEADETFKLTISAPDPEVAGVSLGDAEAVGTIEDDDELTVSVAGPVANVEEGQTATFTVTVTGTSTTAVVVSYEVDTDASTAAAPGDYTALSEVELTIGVGETSGTIEVVTNTDAVLEPHETLVLKLTGASTAGAVGVSATAATATIEDNGTVKVSVADRKASEGGSVGFEVRLSGAVSSEVVVSYATSEDGTGANPAAGTDYTAVSATELTFRPGEALMQTATVATVEDELNEADETFKLTISAPDPEVAGVSLGDAEAVGTIEDDDELTVSVAGPVANVEEGQTATFTVTVTGTSTTAVVVSYEVDTDASTAAAPGDYTALSEVELTIGVGETSGTIEVVTNTDAVLEPDETLVLKLTGASTAGAVGVSATAATATIEDNGTVKVSVADRKASEGGSVGFEVRLSGAVSSEVVVSYATSEDGTGANPAAGTDYTAVSATELTFRPGEALMQTATVATVEDELNEADETFTLTISAPDPEVAGVSLGDAEAVGTIEDDDGLTVSVAGPVANVEEGQTATFTVTVEPQTKDSTTAVVVSYEVDTGASTASSGDDYTAPSGTELTIGVGETSGTIEIVTNTDSVLEPHETLVLELTGASTAGEVSVSATAATAQATIEDKGTVTVSVNALTVLDNPETLDVDESDDKSVVAEGQSSMFEVLLSRKVASVVQVSYSTGADGDTAEAGTGKDYTAATGKLTFAANETSKTVEVATLEDDLNEADETFTLTITAPDPPVAGVSLGTSSATGRITDTDALSVSVTADQTSVNEGETATFTVTLSEDSTSTAEVVVDYEVGGPATAGEDYTDPSRTLTIATGVASGTISIETLEDYLVESAQKVTVALVSAASSNRSVTVDMDKNEAEVTIVDTTTGGPVLKDPDSVPIGNSASVQVSPTTRRSATAEEAGQAETVARKNTVTACTWPCILEGTSVTRDVSFEDEDDHTTIRLEMGQTFVASYYTEDITPLTQYTAVAGADYAALSGTLTLTYDNTKEGGTPPKITFVTRSDMLPEEDETFKFTIDAADLPGGGSTSQRVWEVTIRDAAPSQGTRPTVTFSSPDRFPATSTFTLVMTFSESVTGFELEDIEVTNGTADGFDGTGRSYSVEITPDDDLRGDMIVAVPANVAYSAAHRDMGNVGARVRLPVDTTATVPDVVEVDVSFGAAAYTALEDGSPATVTVLLSADPERTVVVPLTARNGNGASDDDYSGVPEQVTFASGQTSTTFTVTATSDLDEDAGETVILGFGELPAAVSTGSPGRATITLAGESSKTRYARVMRTLLPRAAAAMSDATVGAISNRIDNVGSQGNLSLAGVNVLPSASVAAQERSADAISWASRDQTTRNISSAQLMDGSSFVMTLADRARLAGAADPSGSNPGTAALWGSGDYRNLAGSQNALAWRGNLVSLHLGADLVALPELVAGVAVARSLVGFDYTDRTNPRTVTGKFETDLLSVHPYASWTPTFGLGFWATGGVGWGGVGIDDNLDVRRTSTTRLLTGALGGSSRLLSVDGLIPGGATALRLKGEGFVTQTLAEENGPIVAQDVGVQRVRLALEGSHEQRGLWGSILTPALEVGLRHDGGDAAQGAGLELGGELRYVQPELGLTVEGRGRVLTTHRAATEEWGVGGKIQLDLGADRQGLSLSLAPSLGVAASGTHTLWQQGVVPGSPLGLPSSGVTDVTSRLDAQADYGLLAMGGQGMLTPYGGFSLAGRAGRDYRAGARLETDTFNLSLEGMRSERDSGVVDHGVTVQGAIRF